ERIPDRARRAAWAAGLEPLLARILRERATAPDAASPALIQMQAELTLRLLAFQSQLSAAAFEAGYTADAIQSRLGQFGHDEQSHQISYAIASLIVGAVAGTAAGVWDVADDGTKGPAVVGISGGAAATVLSALAFAHEEHRVIFQHPRNRL